MFGHVSHDQNSFQGRKKKDELKQAGKLDKYGRVVDSTPEAWKLLFGDPDKAVNINNVVDQVKPAQAAAAAKATPAAAAQDSDEESEEAVKEKKRDKKDKEKKSKKDKKEKKDKKDKKKKKAAQSSDDESELPLCSGVLCAVPGAFRPPIRSFACCSASPAGCATGPDPSCTAFANPDAFPLPAGWTCGKCCHPWKFCGGNACPCICPCQKPPRDAPVFIG